ncbi:MAG TPA: hypothetical protein DCG33_06015 [Prevotellaceae bacterium]|nr:hypothetical protein [Prevotellaceae bacterium]
MGKNIIIAGADFSNSTVEKSFGITDITNTATFSAEGTQFITYINNTTAYTSGNIVYSVFFWAAFQKSSGISSRLIIIDVEAYQGKILREYASYRANDTYGKQMWWKAFASELRVSNPYTYNGNTVNGATIVQHCDTPSMPNDGTSIREWRIPTGAKYFITSNITSRCANPKWWIIDA